jgi:hypothetical protein
MNPLCVVCAHAQGPQAMSPFRTTIMQRGERIDWMNNDTIIDDLIPSSAQAQ